MWHHWCHCLIGHCYSAIALWYKLWLSVQAEPRALWLTAWVWLLNPEVQSSNSLSTGPAGHCVCVCVCVCVCACAWTSLCTSLLASLLYCPITENWLSIHSCTNDNTCESTPLTLAHYTYYTDVCTIVRTCHVNLSMCVSVQTCLSSNAHVCFVLLPNMCPFASLVAIFACCSKPTLFLGQLNVSRSIIL